MRTEHCYPLYEMLQESDKPCHWTRNPLIFGLFTRMHLVERVVSGIPHIQEAMREANLPEPEFHTEGVFTAVFKRKYSVMGDTVNEKEQEVLNLLKKQAGLNATEIAQRLGKSIPTIKRYLT